MLLPVPFRHQLLGKGVAVGPAFGIETRAGVTVPVPGAADVRATLEHPCGHAQFAQAVEHIHAGNPGADDDGVVDRKPTLACAFRQGVCVRHDVVPYRDTRPKFAAGHPSVPSPGQTTSSTIIDKGSPTSIRQDKQMPNTALALLDTVTEPAIAVEVRTQCE